MILGLDDQGLRRYIFDTYLGPDHLCLLRKIAAFFQK